MQHCVKTCSEQSESRKRKEVTNNEGIKGRKLVRINNYIGEYHLVSMDLSHL